MTVQEALTLGISLLKEAGIDDPGRDARRLMVGVLGIEMGRLTLHVQDEFDPLGETNFFAAIVERQKRRPLSHLLGYREFYGRRFHVSSSVLDPRGDTETLIEAALRERFTRVLDLGVGSGCILLTLLSEYPDGIGVGTDVSKEALGVANQNAKAFGVDERCTLIESNWFEVVGGKFDLIVSNPPYIAAEEMAGLEPELSYEPRIALTDEGDGLSAYRVITTGAGVHLEPQGRLMVEIGWTQGAAVAEMFRIAGFQDVAVLPDLDGQDRVVTGRWLG